MRTRALVVCLSLMTGCYYVGQERVVVVDDRCNDVEGDCRDVPDQTSPGVAEDPGEEPCDPDKIEPPEAMGPDGDGDGLSDSDEAQVWGTLPDVADSDHDGLGDGQEIVIGTDPVNPDTDADGLEDGAEIAACTDPLVPDTDGDGLLDGAEIYEHGTNPRAPDSDKDGVPDGDEIDVGTDPSSDDTDQDGLSDGDEIDGDTDPLDPDTDADGLDDGDEVDIGTNPLDPDTDQDGVSDGDEVDAGSNPLLEDTDGDGLNDGPEDSLGTDPTDPDTDDDGSEDGEEVADGTDPFDPDSDLDGLLDGEEKERGTDPLVDDTDGDGDLDGKEVDQGSDPLDPHSRQGDGGEAKWAYRYQRQCGCDTTTPAGMGLGALMLVGLVGLRRRRGALPGAASGAAAVALLGTLGMTQGGCYQEDSLVLSGTDYIPVITEAYARCGVSRAFGPMWAMGVTVDDIDGSDDVIGVEARVYDEGVPGVELVLTTNLVRTAQPTFWYTEMLPDQMDCSYGNYTVDFYAYDRLVASDSVTVWAEPLY